MPPGGIDWICVSPKAGAPLVVTRGHELKVVVPQDGLDPLDFAGLDFHRFSVQPMDAEPAGPAQYRVGDPALLPRPPAMAAEPANSQDHRYSLISHSSKIATARVQPGRSAADLDREAAHREPVWRQGFEVVQLFEVAIADLAARLVPLPDQPGIAAGGRFSRLCTKGASQLQPSVPVSRTPRSSRYSVASRPMPQPAET
jgi:hypothetical protein